MLKIEDIESGIMFSNGTQQLRTVSKVSDGPDPIWYATPNCSGKKRRGASALHKLYASDIVNLVESGEVAKLRQQQDGRPVRSRDRMVIKCNPAHFNAA